MGASVLWTARFSVLFRCQRSQSMKTVHGFLLDATALKGAAKICVQFSSGRQLIQMLIILQPLFELGSVLGTHATVEVLVELLIVDCHLASSTAMRCWTQSANRSRIRVKVTRMDPVVDPMTSAIL